MLLNCQPSAVDYTTSGELTFTFAEAGDSFIEVVSLNPDDEIVTSMQLQEEYRTTIGAALLRNRGIAGKPTCYGGSPC